MARASDDAEHTRSRARGVAHDRATDCFRQPHDPFASSHPIASSRPITSSHPIASSRPITSSHPIASSRPITSSHPIASSRPNAWSHAIASSRPNAWSHAIVSLRLDRAPRSYRVSTYRLRRHASIA
ncbi:hypothetical protein KZ686_04895 [Cupriavidus cauae]|nr:hypothetical protein KZ686_04895 [Cupriavidus cauae]